MSDGSETAKDAAAGPPAPAPAASTAVVAAARWFWWIAGLSLINVVLTRSGSDTNFVLGLGVTLVADAMFAGSQAVALSIDAIAIAFFFLMGWQAQGGRLWAFVLGTGVYALDALIYLRFEAWMPLAFHALAIFFLVRGALMLRRQAGSPA
jgi:hypothetical protein